MRSAYLSYPLLLSASFLTAAAACGGGGTGGTSSSSSGSGGASSSSTSSSTSTSSSGSSSSTSTSSSGMGGAGGAGGATASSSSGGTGGMMSSSSGAGGSDGGMMSSSSGGAGGSDGGMMSSSSGAGGSDGGMMSSSSGAGGSDGGMMSSSSSSSGMMDAGMPTTFLVVRVGDGAAALTNASAAVNIEKRDLMGAMVGNPIAMPVMANGAQRAFTLAGTSTSEGGLALSANGAYVTLAGYDSAPGVANVGSSQAMTVNRVAARIDAMGNVDTSTAINDGYNGSNVRSAVTTDGTAIWFGGTGNGGTGGVRYATLGATTSTQVLATPNNSRWVNIFSGQLYATSGSNGFNQVFAVGMGLPTMSGQLAALTPGLPTATASPYGFAFFDMNANVAGVDTLYLGDDRSTASGGGIQKWTFDGTTWTLTTTFTPPAAVVGMTIGVRGLATKIINGFVNIVAVTTDNRIVAMIDDGTASPVFADFGAAPVNTAFRGVAFSPQ